MELSSTVALPLPLLRSDTIPPSPTRCPTGSTIDWIPDFAGYAWVAYGASSLLVISHLPSPLSHQEISIAPTIFRQVFQLPHHVAAVSWSSDGEVAAASGDCIFLFFPDPAESSGSFCWSQNAILRQSVKVEAVSWTGSGDGIVAGGVEVILWKRKSTTWEIAGKFIEDLPQTLVSTTWTIEGPSATAACPYKQHKEESSAFVGSQYVSVFQNDGKNEYLKAELCHPLPVLMIQWRPLTGVRQRRNLKTRNVLLTCCLDGATRLWTEIDHGRAKKAGKDANNSKIREHSFCVVAIVETEAGLHAAVPGNWFVVWAREAGRLSKLGGTNCIISTDTYDHEETGQCEWLVGFCQDTAISFWAIHCLDEFSPLRYPRVTLWKKKELQGIESEYACNIARSIAEEGLVSKKVIISRKSTAGPPMLCSFLHYSKYNLVWSLFYKHELSNEEDLSTNMLSSERLFSCSAGGVLSSDGHSGKILQAAVHPYFYEDGLLASLDSNGLLLFWSFPSISAFSRTIPLSVPTLKLLGRISTDKIGPKYTSLRWAPSVMDDDLLVLLGHVDGIDCLVVRISKQQHLETKYHKLCTIPISKHGPIHDDPADIYSVFLPLPCSKTYKSAKLMLLGVWMKSFLAVSWEIVIHSYDLSRSFNECNCNNNLSDNCNTLKCKGVFGGRRYCLSISPCSSQFPSPNDSNQVTSFSVVCPSSFCSFVQQDQNSTDALHYSYSPYIIATGYADGSLKLWRNGKGEFPSSMMWELVGTLAEGQGPISKISLSDYGQKMATVCASGHPDIATTLNIWESMTIVGAGCFVLEDTLSLDSDVISMKWLTVGNGNHILGVCMKDKLQVYAQRCFGGQCVPKSANSSHMHVWFCIAYALISPPASDFFWGRGTTAAVVHQDYINLYGQLLQCQDDESWGDLQTVYEKKITMFSEARGAEAGTTRDLGVSTDGNHQVCSFRVGVLHGVDGVKNQILSGKAILRSALPPKLGSWSMLEVVEQQCGSLPIYHPEVLLYNILSGNWRRACIGLEHLVAKLPGSTGNGKNHYNSSFTVPQIDLSSYLEGVASGDLSNKGFQWSGDTAFASSGQFDGHKMFSASSNHDFVGIAECVERNSKAVFIHDKEKIEILSVIDLLSEVSNSRSTSAYESLDDPGRRFWVTVRYQQLHFFRKFGKAATAGNLVTDSSTICWAFHSECQESLLGSILPNEPTWQEIRSFGVGFWFTNVTHLRTRMEKLARLQYLKRKDPKDCALLYIALNRIQVLSGLFKISKDEKDKPLVAFLSRNFQEEKNKSAALKNAYVLLGRHQLELAMAFFLLGGDTYSAISVCAKNFGDEQLALVLCRLIEGPSGQSEHQLINKFMLPSAIEKRDYWLTSILEWQLGNYSRSFFWMLGFQDCSLIDKSSLSSNHIAFLDPSIGMYCRMLTTKNHLKNAVGEHVIPVLLRWANLSMATALKRCGLPIEALECLLFLNLVGNSDHGSMSGQSEMLIHKLNPSSVSSSNWILGDVAINLEYQLKLDLVLQHLSKFMREHPSWPNWTTAHVKKHEIHEYDELRGNFNSKLYRDLDLVEQKFSLHATSVITRILVLPFNYGASYIGYDLLRGYRENLPYVENTFDLSNLYSLHNLPLTLSAEFSTLFSQFSALSGISYPQTYPHYKKTGGLGDFRSKCSVEWETRAQDLKLSLWNLRAALQIFSDSDTDLIKILQETSDLIEFLAQFASIWFQRNSRALILILQPLLMSFTNGHTPYEVQLEDLKKVLNHLSGLVPPDSTSNGVGSHPLLIGSLKDKNVEYTVDIIPEDDRWQILGASLWLHISRFTSLKLNISRQKLDGNILSGSPVGVLTSDCSSVNLDAETKNSKEKMRTLSSVFLQSLLTAIAHVSSYQVKELAALVHREIDDGWPSQIVMWLRGCSRVPTSVLHDSLAERNMSLDADLNNNESLAFKILWDEWADPKIISEGFAEEQIELLEYFQKKPFTGWKQIHKSITIDGLNNNGDKHKNSSAMTEAEPSSKGSSPKEESLIKETAPFLKPREICKRNGELLEALCINSTAEQQIAVSSNRKGIIFVNWEDDLRSREETEYVWSLADWPQNGWACAESTPVPTYVSPGVGLGTKKGAHLGLGGATIGTRSLAAPGRDLTGGGAFGIPGYAGMGASGLGWEVSEEFEEVVEQPATLENVRGRAFSRHPSMPYFLAGSSNTHIYLWEFGKERATATYGVLPAANVPPPYSLASISALQFEHCGHRFATAALDGTVCTWMLEVGGRSNVHPTESSLCFNDHAMDVAYVTSSGTIIAAAGYSSNNVNVVIWDTIAPSSTSRASIICHDGGASSIAVFDKEIGSSSVSPLIVTGGKGGDIGLHDFRYIATGRSKRHQQNSPSSSTTSEVPLEKTKQHGVENVGGMLWHLPKAHSGSVTKISWIPNTSLFLTGGKDGDVKLWDVTNAKLVHHWPKLHDRHTFLQPTTRGFGGVVRAGVTDVQVVSRGFLTCGGDGTVKLVEVGDYSTLNTFS